MSTTDRRSAVLLLAMATLFVTAFVIRCSDLLNQIP